MPARFYSPLSGAIEEEGYDRGFKLIAGVDEAGRGPLAGPVVAAAVILPRGFTHVAINDSKLLTARQREAAVPVIEQNSISWGLGICDVEEIDRINILKASLMAMVKAWRSLCPAPDYLLVDGNQIIPPELFPERDTAMSAPPMQRTIVKGDQLCPSIAAASILAKVARDRIMVELDQIYPGYGFASHKGYGSPAHLDALRRLGPTPRHRKSFRPVREAYESGNKQGQGSIFIKEQG